MLIPLPITTHTNSTHNVIHKGKVTHKHYDGDGYVNDVLFDEETVEKWIKEVWPKDAADIVRITYIYDAHLQINFDSEKFDPLFYTDRKENILFGLSPWYDLPEEDSKGKSSRVLHNREKKEYLPYSKELQQKFIDHNDRKIKSIYIISQKYDISSAEQKVKLEVIKKAKEFYAGAKIDLLNQQEQKESMLCRVCAFLYSTEDVKSIVKSKVDSEITANFCDEAEESLLELREEFIKDLRENFVAAPPREYLGKTKDAYIIWAAVILSLIAGIIYTATS